MTLHALVWEDGETACPILAGDASALAGAFGLMNLFARSLGGSVLDTGVSLCF